MRKQIVLTLTVLALLASTTLTPVHAGLSRSVVANIPFDFTIGKKLLPAGKYSVSQVFQSSDRALSIRNENGKGNAMFLVNSAYSVKAASADKSKLVFRRYGERYYLAQIWRAGDAIGHQVPISHSERVTVRQLASNATSPKIAQKLAEPTLVTIVAE